MPNTKSLTHNQYHYSQHFKLMKRSEMKPYWTTYYNNAPKNDIDVRYYAYPAMPITLCNSNALTCLSCHNVRKTYDNHTPHQI